MLVMIYNYLRSLGPASTVEAPYSSPSFAPPLHGLRVPWGTTSFSSQLPQVKLGRRAKPAHLAAQEGLHMKFRLDLMAMCIYNIQIYIYIIVLCVCARFLIFGVVPLFSA